MDQYDYRRCPYLCGSIIGFFWFKLGDPYWLYKNYCRPVVLFRLIITSGDFYPQSVVSASQQQYYTSLWHICSSATVMLHNSIMLAFSSTSYYPFDSEAPAVFGNTQTNNYLNSEWLKQSHDINIISLYSLTSCVHGMAI